MSRKEELIWAAALIVALVIAIVGNITDCPGTAGVYVNCPIKSIHDLR